jgi:hypothetical protein
MLWEKLDRGNDLLTMEEDFPPILMYWASVIVTARIGKPSVARFVPLPHFFAQNLHIH